MVPAFFRKAMILFNCDYSEGAHADILRRLAETNMEQTAGYGEDPYCERARKLIASLCGRADLDVHFLIGETQTNFTVIAAALRPHQCVLCADTGHINVHESGAVEACGHKVFSIPSPDGKLTARQIEEAWHAHWDDETHEHMPQPKIVYISLPTELGTIYSRKEFQEISEVCRYRGCTCTWTARASATACVMKGTIWICRRSPSSATLFTSAARRSAPCSEKLSSCVMTP